MKDLKQIEEILIELKSRVIPLVESKKELNRAFLAFAKLSGFHVNVQETHDNDIILLLDQAIDSLSEQTPKQLEFDFSKPKEIINVNNYLPHDLDVIQKGKHFAQKLMYYAMTHQKSIDDFVLNVSNVRSAQLTRFFINSFCETLANNGQFDKLSKLTWKTKFDFQADMISRVVAACIKDKHFFIS